MLTHNFQQRCGRLDAPSHVANVIRRFERARGSRGRHKSEQVRNETRSQAADNTTFALSVLIGRNLLVTRLLLDIL